MDIVSPDAKLAGYQIIMCPLQIFWSQALSNEIAKSGAFCVLGPRSGSKTSEFQIPPNLAPGEATSLIDVTVTRVESLRASHSEMAGPYKVSRWLEHIDSPLTPKAKTPSGRGVWYQNERCDYLACWPEAALLHDVLSARCEQAGIKSYDLPEGLRVRRRGDVMFAINYEASPVNLGDHLRDVSRMSFLIGGPQLPPAGVAAWTAT